MKRITEFLSDNFSQNQLFKGSFILFIGTMIANFGSYLYHLLVGRMLGPSEYGIVSSLLSLTYLFNIPVTTLTMVVVKYTSSLYKKKGIKLASNFYYWINQKLVPLSILGLSLLIAISPFLQVFLHLKKITPILIVIFYNFVGVFFNLNMSTLQGLLCFSFVSLMLVICAFLKVVLSVGFIYLGGKSTAAVFSILISVLIGFLLSFLLVKRLFGKNTHRKEVNKGEILKYAFPVFLSIISLTSFYTIDIVLARHFLSEREAGFYSALALLGKIVFFASSSVTAVMFPIISGKSSKKEDYRKVLATSFLLVLGISLFISVIYFIFPELVITLLFGRKYLLIASNLGFFSLFIIFYSLSNLLINFYLSISKTGVVFLPLTMMFLQVLLINLFHRTIRQIISVNILVMAVLTFGLLFPIIIKRGKVSVFKTS
jgi:O-antigen/teichoic acid export membrane protein